MLKPIIFTCIHRMGSNPSVCGIVKASAFKKLLLNLEFKPIAFSFTLDNQSNDDVNLLGKKAMSILCRKQHQPIPEFFAT